MGCFEGHGLLKASQQPGEPEEIPSEGSGTDSPRYSACGDSRVASVLRLALRQRVAILSDIITNENLKLLQINYLVEKVDVLFTFPSRSHCTCNRTYGKTMYTTSNSDNFFKSK